MAERTRGFEPHRDVKRTADGVNRADARLRPFGRREGDAVMCPRCDGAGVILGREMHWSKGRALEAGHLIPAPVKCTVCGGDGLDPNARQGGE